MKKIDIEKLGEIVTEYREGVPWSSTMDAKTAARQVAEKVNEIIDFLADIKET